MSPRVLVLWADESSPNLGVRALARGTAALARSVWPTAEVTTQNFGSRIPQLPIGSLRSLWAERALNRRGTHEWFRRFDIVIDSRSGDSFADIYGLRRLSLMSTVAGFAARAGVPVVLGPQTVGPFDSAVGASLARRSLASARLVLARDSASARVANRLSRARVITATDVVFALDVPSVERSRDVLLNVSGLLWKPNPHVDHLAYRRTLTGLHASLRASGRHVSVLAHVIDSPNADSDAVIAREFASAVDADVIVPRDLDHVREAVASAHLVIGSRMHACLNALSVGTPAIPLAYSDKFTPLLADLGWRHSVDLRRSRDPVGEVVAAAASTSFAEVREVQRRASVSLGVARRALAEVSI